MARKTRRRPDAEALRWVPAKGLKRAYELRTGDETVGHIRWPKLFGSLAEAEFEGHRWTFKRGGFLRPHVTVREESSGPDVAVLELSWSGSGRLKMRDGARFRWERSGFWARRFAFADESGAEVISVKATFGLVRRTGVVDISADGARMPARGMLAMLGWYVIMLITDDEAVVICCS